MKKVPTAEYLKEYLLKIYRCDVPFELVVINKKPKTRMGVYIRKKSRIRIYSKWICAAPLEEIAIQEGKVALMFLKSYTGLSAPKLMEQLNANIHYQIFCGIRINSRNPLINYKLIDDIILELSNRLKIQNQQEALAEAWKPYMKNLDTLYTERKACRETLWREDYQAGW